MLQNSIQSGVCIDSFILSIYQFLKAHLRMRLHSILQPTSRSKECFHLKTPSAQYLLSQSFPRYFLYTIRNFCKAIQDEPTFHNETTRQKHVDSNKITELRPVLNLPPISIHRQRRIFERSSDLHSFWQPTSVLHTPLLLRERSAYTTNCGLSIIFLMSYLSTL